MDEKTTKFGKYRKFPKRELNFEESFEYAELNDYYIICLNCHKIIKPSMKSYNLKIKGVFEDDHSFDCKGKISFCCPDCKETDLGFQRKEFRDKLKKESEK